MSHNPLYHKSFPDFIYSFFSFHQLLLQQKELPFLIESFDSTKSIDASNLQELLLEHIFSTTTYEGISTFLPFYIRNSLTRSYFAYLDILGIESEVFEAKSLGLKDSLSPVFLQQVRSRINIDAINRFAEEVNKDVINGHSRLIKQKNIISFGHSLGYLGYGGISTAAVSSVKIALIANGLNYRFSTSFLARQLAKIDPANDDKKEALLYTPSVKDSLRVELLPGILGRTKIEIAQKFGELNGENGGCPTTHNPHSKLSKPSIDVGSIFNYGILEMLAFHLEKFLETELLPMFFDLPEAEKKAFFKEWERDLITKNLSYIDQEIFKNRFGDLENYYKEIAGTTVERLDLYNFFSKLSEEPENEFANR
jgi:hypothetical protein